MLRPANLLSAACLALAALVVSTAATAADAKVLAQDLVKVRASSKVSAALWTRRPGSYTLQLVLWRDAFPEPLVPGARNLSVANVRGLVMTDGRRSAQAANTPAEAQVAKKLETRVWLLRADGTQIAAHLPSTNPSVSNCTLRCNVVDVLYRFSIDEASQAVAAAVMIGEEFYIEKLQPLEPSQSAN